MGREKVLQPIVKTVTVDIIKEASIVKEESQLDVKAQRDYDAAMGREKVLQPIVKTVTVDIIKEASIVKEKSQLDVKAQRDYDADGRVSIQFEVDDKLVEFTDTTGTQTETEISTIKVVSTNKTSDIDALFEQVLKSSDLYLQKENISNLCKLLYLQHIRNESNALLPQYLSANGVSAFPTISYGNSHIVFKIDTKSKIITYTLVMGSHTMPLPGLEGRLFYAPKFTSKSVVPIKINPKAKELEEIFQIQHEEVKVCQSILMHPQSNIAPKISSEYLKDGKYTEICDYLWPYRLQIINFIAPGLNERDKAKLLHDSGFIELCKFEAGNASVGSEKSFVNNQRVTSQEQDFLKKLFEELYIQKELTQVELARRIAAYAKNKQKHLTKANLVEQWRYLQLSYMAYGTLRDLHKINQATAEEVSKARQVFVAILKQLQRSEASIEKGIDKSAQLNVCEGILNFANQIIDENDFTADIPVKLIEIASKFINKAVVLPEPSSKDGKLIDTSKLQLEIGGALLKTKKQITAAVNDKQYLYASPMTNAETEISLSKPLTLIAKNTSLVKMINLYGIPGGNPPFMSEIYYLLMAALTDKKLKPQLLELVKKLLPSSSDWKQAKQPENLNASIILNDVLHWQQGAFAQKHGIHPGSAIASAILKDKDILSVLNGDQIIDISEGHPGLLREALQYTYRKGFSRKKVSDEIDADQILRLIASDNFNDIADILFKRYVNKITPSILAQAILKGNNETQALILANPKLLAKTFDIDAASMERILKNQYGFLVKALQLRPDKQNEFKQGGKYATIPGWLLANEILENPKNFKHLTTETDAIKDEAKAAASILANMILVDNNKRAVISENKELFEFIYKNADRDIVYSTDFIRMTVSRTYNLNDTEGLVEFLAELEREAELEKEPELKKEKELRNEKFIDTFCKYNPEFVQKLTQRLLKAAPALKEGNAVTSKPEATTQAPEGDKKNTKLTFTFYKESLSKPVSNSTSVTKQDSSIPPVKKFVKK